MPHVYEIKSPVGLVSQSILDRYNAKAQRFAQTGHLRTVYDQILIIRHGSCHMGHILEPLLAGEAIGITVKCMDGQFEVSEWCLHHSDILLRLLEGTFECDRY